MINIAPTDKDEANRLIAERGGSQVELQRLTDELDAAREFLRDSHAPEAADPLLMQAAEIDDFNSSPQIENAGGLYDPSPSGMHRVRLAMGDRPRDDTSQPQSQP
ncbi:MAG: hypothetical protein WAK55_25240 [Xanthobacteraceae bacterium]